jgi:hypothetical protein
MKRPLKINLQLFADGAPPAGQAPSVADQLGNIFDGGNVATPAPVAPAQPQSPPAPQAQGEPNPPVQAPVQQTPTAESPQPQLILGKFKNTEEVFKSYRNQEQALTKAFMDKSALSKENETLKAQLQELQSKANQPTIPQQPVQPQQPQAQEPVKINPEQYLEGFYKDPVGSIQKIVEDTTRKVTEQVKADLQSEYKPVLSKVEAQESRDNWLEQMQLVSSDKADFYDHLETMNEYISRNGFGNETNPQKMAQILSDAYRWVKGGVSVQPQQQSQPINPDNLLTDEAFIAKILANPAIIKLNYY